MTMYTHAARKQNFKEGKKKKCDEADLGLAAVDVAVVPTSKLFLWSFLCAYTYLQQASSSVL